MAVSSETLRSIKCFRVLMNLQHIGFSIPYAREFLKIPNISFNLLLAVLDGRQGECFLKDAHAAGRDVYTWTVNDTQVMKWTIAHSIDGTTSHVAPVT